MAEFNKNQFVGQVKDQSQSLGFLQGWKEGSEDPELRRAIEGTVFKDKEEPEFIDRLGPKGLAGIPVHLNSYAQYQTDALYDLALVNLGQILQDIDGLYRKPEDVMHLLASLPYIRDGKLFKDETKLHKAHQDSHRVVVAGDHQEALEAMAQRYADTPYLLEGLRRFRSNPQIILDFYAAGILHRKQLDLVGAFSDDGKVDHGKVQGYSRYVFENVDERTKVPAVVTIGGLASRVYDPKASDSLLGN